MILATKLWSQTFLCMGCLKNYCSLRCWKSLVYSRDLWLKSTKLQVFFILLTNNNSNNNNNNNNIIIIIIIIMTTTTTIIIGLLITLINGGCSLLHYFILLTYLVLLRLYILIYQRFICWSFSQTYELLGQALDIAYLFLCNSLLRD